MVDPSVASLQLTKLTSSPTSFRLSLPTEHWAALQMLSTWGSRGAGAHRCWLVGGWIMRTSIIVKEWQRIHTATRYLRQMIRMMSLIHLVNYQWLWLYVILELTTGIKTGKNSIKLWFSFLIWKEPFMINRKMKLEAPQPKALLCSHQVMEFLDLSQQARWRMRTSSNRLISLRSSSDLWGLSHYLKTCLTSL